MFSEVGFRDFERELAEQEKDWPRELSSQIQATVQEELFTDACSGQIADIGKAIREVANRELRTIRARRRVPTASSAKAVRDGDPWEKVQVLARPEVHTVTDRLEELERILRGFGFSRRDTNIAAGEYLHAMEPHSPKRVHRGRDVSANFRRLTRSRIAQDHGLSAKQVTRILRRVAGRLAENYPELAAGLRQNL